MCVCVCVLQTQVIKIQTEHTTERTSDRSLQLRITELLATLELRETLIKRQAEVRGQTTHDTCHPVTMTEGLSNSVQDYYLCTI